jgi:Putative auto-transporter adhesin, head GIN domain
MGVHRHPVSWLIGLAVLAGVAVLVILETPSHTRGEVEGSGVPGVESRALSAFDGIDLAGANNVNVHVGAPQAVSIHGDTNLLTFVTTTVRGGTLRIAQARDFRTHASMRVDVTVPAVHLLVISGSGNVTADGITGNRLTVSVDGAGQISAAGRIETLEARLSGAGSLRLRALLSSDAKAFLDGTGEIRLTATRSLDARLEGTGSIVYTGNPPRLRRVVTGTGAITQAR